ncbi:MAG: NADPH-dependent F420 reductase [Actinomycetota bacterium]|nr:NADPH-dependent F420 reductase [Actinomycetota bacterium]
MPVLAVMHEDSGHVGIVGGTGPAGRALAARLASVGVAVVIGSRSAERADSVCDEIRSRWPDRVAGLRGGANPDAAECPLVVVATPWDAAAATAASLGSQLIGKVVVSMANALAKVGGEFQAVVPPGGSVAVGVQKAVPAARVTAAFHHLPARTVGDLDQPVVGDVLVCGDDIRAVEATADLVRCIPDLRAVHAGGLSAAAPVEALTAVLVGINARYKARASIRLMGLDP